MTFGFTKTYNVLVDLGLTKTLKKNGFVSVANKNIGKNTLCQTETKIAKRLPTGTKPTYDETEKYRKKFS
jgi:hypothetical protein